MSESVEIQSQDYWFKVVDMGQQNWALIDPLSDGTYRAFFVGDTSGVFDELQFPSKELATAALRRNGFAKYSDDPQAQALIQPPDPPFHRHAHPNGPIYSSGRYWR
ncbi:MAG: hypothetical protein C0631_07620 [Sedimenticola sp.]|nr:MAG: hypothetical protein C0631_07620 [Sedimenticola sp.]